MYIFDSYLRVVVLFFRMRFSFYEFHISLPKKIKGSMIKGSIIKDPI
jgi:hypothetical protein